jgi:hypothetical protein
MIKTHVQFFTDTDAKYWSDYVANNTNIYLAFCSDIRSEPATPENIVRNMTMQLDWWKIMNPDMSMFKFRLPWEPGTTEYPEGDIYIQAFPGPTSTETRLIVKKNAQIIKYDNQQYENACFYHNAELRSLIYKSPLGVTMIDRDGIDNCYDCVSMILILAEYLRAVKQPITNLRNLVLLVQKSITYGKHNIKSQTIKYFNNTLTKFKKFSYVICNNTNCNTCGINEKHIDHTASGISKATIENEEKYVNSI